MWKIIIVLLTVCSTSILDTEKVRIRIDWTVDHFASTQLSDLILG